MFTYAMMKMNVVHLSVILLLCTLTAGLPRNETGATCSETGASITPEVCFAAKNDSCSLNHTNNSSNETYELHSYLQSVDRTCQNITIKLRNEMIYYLSTVVNFTNHVYFELTGCDEDECVPGVIIKCTGHESGMFFENIHGAVKMRGVHFEDCQFSVHSFSIEDDQAALYVGHSSAVTLDNVTINNTTGIGLALNSVNTVQIAHSKFIGNRVPEGNTSGGGVYVFAPQNASSNCKQRNTTHQPTDVLLYNFTQCQFINNSAITSVEQDNWTTRTEESFVVDRGGGLSFYLTEHTQCVTIEVLNCTFRNNEALFGAGLSIYLQGAASLNNITVNGCNFTNNSGYPYTEEVGPESGGGGAQVMLAAYPYDHPQVMSHNSIAFRHCRFTDNSAYWGGGLSIVSAHEDGISGDEATNHFLLESCQWQHNRARLGSAIDCIAWNEHGSGALPVVTLRDNKFTNNIAWYDRSVVASIGGSGTLYTDSFPVQLEGNNNFTENIDSAITTVDAVINFTRNSMTYFLRNHGIYGGCLSIYGKGRMVLGAKSDVVFDNNTAFLLGGAIFYHIGGPRNLMTSQNCFIQYENVTMHPKEWDTHMLFTCNSAEMEGTAIYASSLLPCVWNGAPYGHGSKVNKTQAIRQVFRWNDTVFVFDNCSNKQTYKRDRQVKEITTDTLKLVNDSAFQNIRASPGQSLNLSGNTADELESNTYSVFRGDSTDPEIGRLISGGQYIAGLNMKFQGEERKTFSLKLSSPWILSYIINTNVTLLPCPPGLRYSKTSKKCECSVGKASYRGILSCEDDHATLHSSYWAGYIMKNADSWELCSDTQIKESNSCTLVTGRCPARACTGLYTHKLLDTPVPLPTIASNEELTRHFCNEQNRRGILCGKCKEGYGYDIASDTLTCVSCNNDSVLNYIQAWSALLSTRFLPLTIMVAVFLLFDIDILSGSMQSFIFYSQMLSYLSPLLGKGVELRPPVKTMLELSYMLYDIWKLKFGAFLLETTRLGAPPVCTQLSALSLKCLGYITALYPFILIYTIWFLKALQDRGCCCGPCKRLLRKARVAIHRLRRKWSPNSTIIHGLSAFIVFSYTSFLITSVYLVAPSKLMKERGYVVTTHVYLDGSIAFASIGHLPYMICAILVLFTFVAIPPLILILVPLVPRAAVHLQPERSNRLIWLSDKMFAGPKWQFFLDAFQGGFKPKFSFFAGLFFLYRIAITSVYTFSYGLEWQYLIQTVEVVLFLVIHSICQPYKKKIYNIIDTLIYCNMLMVLLSGSFLWYQSSHDLHINATVLWFTIVMMNIPQIGFFVYLIYKAIKGIRKGVVIWRMRRGVNGAPRGERSSEERDLELLTDSFHYRIDYAAVNEDFASEMATMD